MEIVERIREFRKDKFFGALSVLVGGTAFSRALMILSLPLLTRLYTPEHFKLLAVYVSLLGILSVAACLRFEVAIPMPKHDYEAVNLLALSLFFSFLTSSIIAFLVFTFPNSIIFLIKQPELKPYLWLLPVGIFSTGCYNALQYWATRKKDFSAVALTRMTQAVGGVGTQLILGWGKILPLGLLLGHMISSGAGVINLGRRTLRNEFIVLKKINLRNMRRIFCSYSRYPKFSTLEALANTTGIQLPIVIIGALTIGPEAGFLMLAMKAMQMPLSLVGSSVAQVYLSSAAEQYRSECLEQYTSKTLVRLINIGVGPLIFVGFVAPYVFAILFGDEWRRAGELVAWMTPWFILQFIASPISMVMLVQDRQRAFLMLTVFGLFLRTSTIILVSRINQQWLSESYAVSGAIFYGICFYVFLKSAGLSLRGFMEDAKKCYKILLIWSFVGFLLSLLVKLEVI